MDHLPRPLGRRPKRGRLSRSAEFERVYRQGRSVGNRFLVLYTFPRPDAEAADESPRLGVSVSRKVGGAVERNKVKRLLREAFTDEGRRLPSGHDVVVVARPDVRELAEREGLAGVRGALDELIERALAEQSAGGRQLAAEAESPSGEVASAGEGRPSEEDTRPEGDLPPSQERP